LSKPSPWSYESFVRGGSVRFSNGITRLQFVVVDVPVRVCVMRVCSICAVRQESLQNVAIIRVLVRLRGDRVVESDVTLTEK